MTSQKLVFWDFWRTADNVLNTGKPVAPPLFNDPEMLSSASNKAKLLPKTLILKTQNIDIDADDIYAEDTTDQTSNLWEQLEFVFELEYDLQDTADWGGKWLPDFNDGKTEMVSFDWSDNTDAIDVKMDESVRG